MSIFLIFCVLPQSIEKWIKTNIKKCSEFRKNYIFAVILRNSSISWEFPNIKLILQYILMYEKVKLGVWMVQTVALFTVHNTISNVLFIALTLVSWARGRRGFVLDESLRLIRARKSNKGAWEKLPPSHSCSSSTCLSPKEGCGVSSPPHHPPQGDGSTPCLYRPTRHGGNQQVSNSFNSK